jgi:hypothetical protein
MGNRACQGIAGITRVPSRQTGDHSGLSDVPQGLRPNYPAFQIHDMDRIINIKPKISQAFKRRIVRCETAFSSGCCRLMTIAGKAASGVGVRNDRRLISCKLKIFRSRDQPSSSISDFNVAFGMSISIGLSIMGKPSQVEEGFYYLEGSFATIGV